MNKPQKQRFTFIIIGIIIAAIAIYLSIDAFKDKASLYIGPKELEQMPISERTNKTIRLGGLVKEGSLRDADKGGYYFTIIDFQSEVNVYYEGLLPDLFGEGKGVYVDGSFDDTGKLFITKNLLAKHDATYSPPLPGGDI